MTNATKFANAAEPIGFGLVGAGMIANFHAKAIAAIAEKYNLRLVGVLAQSMEKAQKFAEEHAFPFYTDDADAFFSHPDIHVVCIVTPSGAHLAPALAAARAGKHLVVEKPLEITLERVDALLDAVEKADVKIAAIFQARFSSGAQAVKKAVDAGRFGRLSLCSAYVKWHRPASYYTGWKGTFALDGGAVVINQAIHAIDLLQWFAGMPEEIFAWKTRCVHQGIEAEDTACAALKFSSGALGTLEATTAAYPGWGRRIELCGEFGSVAIEDERIVRWEFKDVQPEDAQILASLREGGSGSGAGAPDQIDLAGHTRQIENLVLALRENAPLLVDGKEARHAVAFVRALYESAENGLPVKLAASRF